jgi:tRNA nucleotidyltransferase (CCA-adding enzyme)
MDLDIVVEGEGMAVAQGLAREVGGTLTRHHAFQTARVDTPDGIRIDVATARRETYARPGFLPRVVVGNLQQDLERRDFTINTMAIALNPGTCGDLIDPEGGLADLDAGLVRVLHSRSFADDPTRILRALRFVERFDYRLEERTGHQLEEAVIGGYLSYVSGARVRRELCYLFSEAPVGGAVLLQEHGVLAAIHPELTASATWLELLAKNRDWYASVVLGREPNHTEWPFTRAAESDELERNGSLDPDWTLVLVTCADRLVGQERWNLASHLKLSRAERQPLIEAGAAWQKARRRWEELPPLARRATVEVDEVFSRFAPGTLLVILSGPEARSSEDLQLALRAYLEHTRWVEPGLRGGDLIEMGIAEGPAVGAVLELLRRGRLDGSVEDVEGERQVVLEWLSRQGNEDT